MSIPLRRSFHFLLALLLLANSLLTLAQGADHSLTYAPPVPPPNT